MTAGSPDYFLQMRSDLFDELEAAELTLSRERLRVERMESDLRLGLSEPPGYQEAKGRVLPRAEARVMDLFEQLLKLEDRIRARRQSSAAGT